jgi:hypothetical protein
MRVAPTNSNLDDEDHRHYGENDCEEEGKHKPPPTSFWVTIVKAM